jgi:polyphosphate kinase 2
MNIQKEQTSMSKKHKKEQHHSKESKKLSRKEYESELARLEIELVKMQGWIKKSGYKAAIVFEGRDSAGKGGAIKRITYRLSPRVARVVALAAPTEKEKSQWYFQRYVPHLPSAGEMVLFDRSWYNRSGVERVMGFCTEDEYAEFMATVNGFELALTRSGTKLIKYWLDISDETQEKRFQQRINDPRRRWKLSPMDLEARSKWVDYSRARDSMLFTTSTPHAPWHVANANVKRHARLNIIRHLLDQIPYEDLTPDPLELPPRQDAEGYRHPDFSALDFVPEEYP